MPTMYPLDRAARLNLDLTTLPLDLVKFATFPKCTKGWINTRVKSLQSDCVFGSPAIFFDTQIESGCILTAFLAGLGLNPELQQDQVSVAFRHAVYGKFLPQDVLIMINKAALYLGVSYPKLGRDFARDVFLSYDSQDSSKALNLLWELIEVWPVKINAVTKQEVILPTQDLLVACSV